jgi:anti-sigma factor RsiW
MRCAETARWLDEHIDGTLSPRVATAVERHLAECPRCLSEERALRAVVLAARALPASRPPRRDLWPEVAMRLSAEGGGEAYRPRAAGARVWSRVLAVAAGLVVVAGGALLVGMRLGGLQTRRPAAGPAPSAAGFVPAGAGLEQAAREYEAARAQLLVVLRSRQAGLDEGTVEVVQHNIEVIDRAVAEIRTALSGRPADPALGQLLLATYRQEVDLLQQVTQLPGTA